MLLPVPAIGSPRLLRLASMATLPPAWPWPFERLMPAARVEVKVAVLLATFGSASSAATVAVFNNGVDTAVTRIKTCVELDVARLPRLHVTVPPACVHVGAIGVTD